MLKPGTIIKHTFIVDEGIYVGFKTVFKDLNPMHTDASFAQSKGYKNRVMYGNILNGFLSYLVGELLPIKNVVIMSQNINFTKPVYLNDQVTLEAEITDFFESVKTAEIKFKFTNQGGERVAKGGMQIGII